MKVTKYNYRIAHSVDSYEITEGYYGSKWGLSDLYPEPEANLKSLLLAGNDFHTSWASKKELLSADLLYVDGKLTVTVNAWTDDLWESDDLVYDALWEVAGEEKEISSEAMDEIKDMAFEIGCDDAASAYWAGELLSYDRLLKLIDNLADQADSKCHEYFEMLKGVIKDGISLGLC